MVCIYYKMRQKIFEEGKRVKSEKGKNPEKKTRDENRHCRRRSSSGKQSGKAEGRSTKTRHVVHEFYYPLRTPLCYLGYFDNDYYYCFRPIRFHH